MKKTTLCITTHCVKTERSGPYVGMNNIVPSTPSTKMIEKVIEDFFMKTSLDMNDVNIHIGFDKRIGRPIDELYHQNLSNLSTKYPNYRLFLNESNIDDPIVTAPNNFLKLIGSVETDTYILWEHDWVLNRELNIESIINEVATNKLVNYVRLNQFDNNNIRYDNLIEGGNNPSTNIPLIPTFRWSNNPYVCKTSIFKNWWSTFVYPTSNEGGFVEGPLNEFYTFYINRMGFEEASKRFGCYVYGNWGDSPLISHLNGNNWS